MERLWCSFLSQTEICFIEKSCVPNRRDLRHELLNSQCSGKSTENPVIERSRKKHLRVTTEMVLNFRTTLVMAITIGTDNQNAILANMNDRIFLIYFETCHPTLIASTSCLKCSWWQFFNFFDEIADSQWSQTSFPNPKPSHFRC